MIKDGNEKDFAINRFLGDYRNTEHCTTERTPSYLMFKRELRTRFDLLKPDVTGTVEKNQYNSNRTKMNNRTYEFRENDTVYV